MIPEKIHLLSEQLLLSDYGFFQADDAPQTALPYGISLVLRLSDAVVEEIGDAPTHSYFHHYRAVNAYSDHCMLRMGLLLQREGFRYLPVGASQSIPTTRDPNGFSGLYSHKKAAALAGLGAVGKNNLFLHRRYGPRVRLGTVFTDCPLPLTQQPPQNPCLACNSCVAACPAQALSADGLIDSAACSAHMKRAYQKIGRGAVCGICMAVCPVGKA